MRRTRQEMQGAGKLVDSYTDDRGWAFFSRTSQLFLDLFRRDSFQGKKFELF